MVAAAEKIVSEGRRQKTQAGSTRAIGRRIFSGINKSLRSSVSSAAGGDFVPPVPATCSRELLSGCRGGENRRCTPGSQLPSPDLRACYLQDANWDATAVVGFNSTAGTWGVTQRYAYSPYGNITVLNADWPTPPAGTQPVVNNLYQGMTLDAVTRLYYSHNRNYSPALGTWINQDPAGFIDGANDYRLETGAPIENVDASGLATTHGTLASFDVYEVFGFGGSIDYAKTTKPCKCGAGEHKDIQLSAEVHAGTGIGFDVSLAGVKIALLAQVGPQLGENLSLDVTNSRCGGPYDSGSEQSQFNFENGLTLGAAIPGVGISVAGEVGFALDLILTANATQITFKIGGEVDLKAEIDVSFLWWSHDCALPITPHPGFNEPGILYQHSWPNRF